MGFHRDAHHRLGWYGDRGPNLVVEVRYMIILVSGNLCCERLWHISKPLRPTTEGPVHDVLGPQTCKGRYAQQRRAMP